jgi:hypothetical protein
MKRMSNLALKSFSLVFLSFALAHGDEPRITFEKGTPPEAGIPREAEAQEKPDQTDHGTLAKVLGDTVESAKVRYFSNVWTNEKQVSEYLAGLLANDRTKTYTFQIWQQALTMPEIECQVTYKNHQEGRLLLWDTCACVRDATGKWWFVSLFEYYHAKHPDGTRSLAPKTPKKE